MEIEFKTDLERISFLLEADADLRLGLLTAEGKIELVTEELPADERPKYITNFIGSKQKLVDWIWSNTPEDAKSVLDAFSGSSVVGYMYKTKGLQVFSNDRLSYCHHAARAIVENNNTRLSEQDIESLLKDHNADAGAFIQKNFHGIFFKNDVLALLDVLRANIDALSGTKKSMALFALGKTCMSGGGFGHFSSTTKGGQRNYTAESFIEHYRDNLLRINALVFDNGKENKAFHGDITDTAPKVKADLVYFDPPYATQFSSTNYEKSYHFVEGLMDYWKDKEIDHTKKIRNYKIEDAGVTPATAKQFFTDFLTASKHIPHWLISYRDNAYPTESEIKGIVAGLGKDSRMKSKDHKYQLAGKNRQGDPSNAKERLFICADTGQDAQSLSADAAAAAANHTTLVSAINLARPDAFAAQGIQLSDNNTDGDREFSFILTHAGTNRNGDHFTVEELSARHQTSINKKIDLKHSQDFTDIVGGIIASDVVQEENKSWVECVGELYTNENINSRLAYKLMKKGIITQVSMECDYEEGECSICGKRVQSKADYCVHLKKFKGGEFKGQPVFEILHGITFTGLGLLDRKGADENAKIKQVAAPQEAPVITDKGAITRMDEENKDKKPDDSGSDAAKNDSGGGKDARIKELEQENASLKSQLDEARKELEKVRAEREAAARKTRAEKLVLDMEKRGMAFENDEDRDSELKRLAGLSDDAFSATEAAVKRVKKPKDPAEEEVPGTDPAEQDPATQKDKSKKQPPKKVKAGAGGGMNADADVRPYDVEDGKASLEDRLTSGLMAAYQDRVSAEN